MIITSCGNSMPIAKKLARRLKTSFSTLTINTFPDGDRYMKFNTPVKGKKVVIVHSFQPNPHQSLLDVVFAGQTAKQLGAKKVIVVAPYLAYMRQDKMFNPGECIASRVMADLLNRSIDKIVTIDPHLHRYKSLKDIFTIATKKLTANGIIADFIKKKYKNVAIIGPDWESYQWAEAIAKSVKAPVSVFEKTRYSSRHVAVKMKKEIELKGKHVIIVDDIISTGHTIAQAAKKAKSLGAKKITAIGVHGLLVENAVSKLKKAGVDEVVTTNCIAHATNRIDVTSLLEKAL